jgi:hypothetical protein
LWCGLIVLGFLVHSGNGFAQKQSFRYTARLASPLPAPGEFKAPKLVWSCKGDVCVTHSPVAVPNIAQCRELAKLVGRVSAFGNENKSLGATGIAECAKAVQVANRAPLPGPNTLVVPRLPGLGLLPPSLFADTGKSKSADKGK